MIQKSGHTKTSFYDYIRSGLSVSFYKNLPNIMIVSDGSKYGALDTKGIVVADCSYDSLVSGDGDTLIFRKGTSYFVVNDSGRDVVEKETGRYTWLKGNLFSPAELAEDVLVDIQSEEKSLFKFYDEEGTYLNQSSSFAVQGTDYQAYVVSYTLNDVGYCVILSKKSTY